MVSYESVREGLTLKGMGKEGGSEGQRGEALGSQEDSLGEGAGWGRREPVSVSSWA